MQAQNNLLLTQKIQESLVEIKKVVVGQDYMIHRLLIGLFTNGHILLEGMPGLAKTLTVNTLSKVLGLDFQRIQFTPDLLPSDLIGTMIYNQAKGVFEVKKGPIFSNIILADEINRSPAKVQSALLECMAERQVTIGETTYPLDEPFLVLATQNPIEQEGTYNLPEAQVDRFLMKVKVGYPSKEDEFEVMRRMTKMDFRPEVKTVLHKEDLFAIKQAIGEIHLESNLEKYIVELVFATRIINKQKTASTDLRKYIEHGVSPRATIGLNLAAKANAFLAGRGYVIPDDVQGVLVDIFAHRLALNYEAEADGISKEQVVDYIMQTTPINQ